jgi:hypothetical protein
MQGKTHLLEDVRTLDAAGSFPYLLHGGQEEGDKDADDGQDH